MDPVPAYRPATVPELASAIRELLSRDDESLALRVMLDGLNRLPIGIGDDDAQTYLAEPEPIGDVRWDTLLAASVAYVCRKAGEPIPGWTTKDTLPQWWWPAGEVVLRAQTMQRTPIDFKRVAIWFDERNFRTA